MSKCYRLIAISEATAPITHMAGVSGNESIVAREPVATERGTAWVPHLSGNALRHRCVREPGMRHLIDACGLAGSLTLEQMNFLLHGGALTKGGGVEDLPLVIEVAEVAPLVKLVGGALPAQILAGSLNVGRGMLACEENQACLRAMLPEGALPDSALRPAESFVSGYQYTRGDARKTAPKLAKDLDDGSDGNLMIFAGQAVMRGAIFVHSFVVRHGELIEVGALVDAIARWQAAGGTIGGQASRGHGSLSTTLVNPDGIDLDACRAEYLESVEANKERFADWLTRAFAAKSEPKAKASKKVVRPSSLIEEDGDAG